MNDIVVPKSFREKPYARERFTEIVSWASRSHPFYQRFIPEPCVDVPIIQRNDILENNDLLLNGHPETDATSGSTGVRVRLSSSPERYLMEVEHNNLFRDWMGGPLSRSSIISIVAHEQLPNTLEVNSPLAEQVRFLQDQHKANASVALLTYPTNLEMLCKYILEHKLDFSYMQRVICMSEAYEPYHDELISQAFPNAKAWSNYSSSETGIIAIRCPENPENHHVMGNKLGLEILNENDEPCEIGQIGRIILTDFFNRRAPFIRYEIGDLAAPAICDCEITTRLAIQKIAGKVRGALVHKDGYKIMYTDLAVALRKAPGTKQFQVIQEGLEDFVLRYVPEGEVAADVVEEAIFRAFEGEFGYRPNITFIVEAEIEREENGKFYGSKCNI